MRQLPITERSNSIISSFITGYHLLQYMLNKLIYLMLFCTLEASTITRKVIIHILKTMFKTITSPPNVTFNWINKPRLRSRKFSQELRTSKKLWYNERNCKSARHSCQNTFMKHKSQTRHTTMNIPNPGLNIKGKRFGLSSLHLLEDEIICFVLSCVVKIIVKITKTISMPYRTMDPVYLMITYPRNKAEMTVFLSNFPDIVF